MEEEQEGLRVVPKETLVYEIEGPMFFAVADQFLNVSMDKDTKVVIMRMQSVPAMDVSALRKLQEVCKICEKHHVTLLFSHVTAVSYTHLSACSRGSGKCDVSSVVPSCFSVCRTMF